MDGSFTTTVQFPSKQAYKKLKMLGVLNSKTVGEQLQELVDKKLGEFTKAELRKLLKGHPDLLQVVLS